jgi:hypothetical protein
MSAELSTPSPRADLAETEVWQRVAWSTVECVVVGTTPCIVGENQCEAVGLRSGARAPNVATDSGNAPLAAARRSWEVTRTDYPRSRLDSERERAHAEGYAIGIRDADAEIPPFPDALFDAELSTFGAMFETNHDRAARELVRARNTGKTFGPANWTPESCIGQWFVEIGRHIPSAPGVRSPALWGTRQGLGELARDVARKFRRAGRDFAPRYHSASRRAESVRAYCGRNRKTFQALDTERHATFTNDCLARMRGSTGRPTARRSWRAHTPKSWPTESESVKEPAVLRCNVSTGEAIPQWHSALRRWMTVGLRLAACTAAMREGHDWDPRSPIGSEIGLPSDAPSRAEAMSRQRPLGSLRRSRRADAKD